ncbi:hypothetical protein OAK34_01285 [Akkermansiaceae bacterium]|nr:hypothetical protein [Akkermansiaceae bacterium]MDC0271729.1 hypothetical protein [Akkermansiaceae bacterium]
MPQPPVATYRVEYEPSRGSWLLTGRHPSHLKTIHPTGGRTCGGPAPA